MIPEQARARARILAEHRVAEAKTRLDFATRNEFSEAKMVEYRTALEMAEAALWPWLEVDRMVDVFRRYYEAGKNV